MRILFILGTRPEAIKLAPLIKTLKSDSEHESIVCTTGQHKEMLVQVLGFFKISPDFELNLMTHNQSLFEITASILQGLNGVLETTVPDWVFVQGDTTTAFVGALAAFYKKIKIAHVEAGLRSNDLYSPFPEEGNRQLVGRIANLHFAPTESAKKALLEENILESQIHVVGNTVIDALLSGLNIIKENDAQFKRKFEKIDFKKKVILVTGHRRESFGKPLENICQALVTLARENKEVEIVYPVHLNPQVRKVVFEMLSDQPNIHLTEPILYPEMIWMMSKCYFILTDSGGIQEEAPSLGKPVLVMRDVTERVEGINANTAKLVATDPLKIVKEATALLNNNEHYSQMSLASNPYGNGQSSRKIVQIIDELND